MKEPKKQTGRASNKGCWADTTTVNRFHFRLRWQRSGNYSFFHVDCDKIPLREQKTF